MKRITTKYFILLFVLFCAATSSVLQAQDSIKVNVPNMLSVIETGLQNNYNIQISKKRMDISKNEIRIYKGAFDPALTFNVEALPETQPGLDYKDKYGSSLSFVKPTQMGVNVAAGLNVNNGYNLDDPNNLYSASGFWLDVEIPVLKGLGKDNRNLINYQISQLEYETQQIAFEYEITRFIKDISLAYINLYVQDEQHAKYLEIQQDLKKYRADIKAQVDDGFIPATELISLDVEILQFESNINSSINSLNSSYIELERLIGENTEHCFVSKVEMPFIFPEIDHHSIKIYVDKQLSEIDQIVAASLDFIQQKNAEESSKMELRAAKNDKLNDLNVSLRYNNYAYTTGDSRKINAFSDSSYPGSSYTIGINYKLPFNNDKASGYYLAKMDEYKLQSKRSEQLEFEKKKELQDAAASLLNIAGIYRMQIDICKLRKKAYENEQLKYQTGNSTQMDVINTHRDYSDALLNQLKLKYQLAESWVVFKFLCNKIPRNSTELANFNAFNLN